MSPEVPLPVLAPELTVDPLASMPRWCAVQEGSRVIPFDHPFAASLPPEGDTRGRFAAHSGVPPRPVLSPTWRQAGIDGVYVINLYERPERLKSMRFMLKKAELLDAALILQVQRHIDGFISGCWSSHKQIAAHALCHGCERILILEDDVQPLDSDWRDYVPRLTQMMDDAPETGVERFLLGGMPVMPFLDARYGFKAVRGQMLCTHAYLANSKHMRRLVRAPNTRAFMETPRMGNTGIDYWLRQTIPQGSLALFPSLARQSQEFVSDHEMRTRPIAGSRLQSWMPLMVFVLVGSTVWMLLGGAAATLVLLHTEPRARRAITRSS